MTGVSGSTAFSAGDEPHAERRRDGSRIEQAGPATEQVERAAEQVGTYMGPVAAESRTRGELPAGTELAARLNATEMSALDDHDLLDAIAE